MTSGRRLFQAGFTLTEVVIVIVVIGVLTAMGSALLGNLAPSYFASVNSAQTLLAPEAAVWQMRQDFAHMVLNGVNPASGTYQDGSCNLIIHTTANYIAAPSYITYAFSANQITRTVGAGTATLLIDNVTATPCPYTLQIGSSSPTRLSVDFLYSTDPNKKISGHMQTTLYSNTAVPYVQSITTLAGAGTSCDFLAGGTSATITGTSLLSVTGVAFGIAPGGVGSFTGTSATVTTGAPGAGLWNVVLSTQDGKYTLQNAFRYFSATLSSTGTGGGVQLSISGTGLASATDVTFGGVSGTAFSVTGDTLISVTTPVTAPAGADAVTIYWGSTPSCTLASTYTY